MNPIMHRTLSGECVHHNRRLNTELAFKAAAHSTFHYSFVLTATIKCNLRLTSYMMRVTIEAMILCGL